MLKCIYFFVIGAFIGWMLECTFKFMTKNFDRAPGILNTPFCILYGVGTVFLSLVINKVTNNFILLFILSFVILTTLEYITFILLYKIYNLRLWDYNNMKFNLRGIVCIEFSIIWGVLGACYIKFLLPLLNTFYYVASNLTLKVSLYTLLGIIVIDFICSSYILLKKKKLIYQNI